MCHLLVCKYQGDKEARQKGSKIVPFSYEIPGNITVILQYVKNNDFDITMYIKP